MMILYIEIKLHAEWCNSLKDKRSEVKRILAGLRNKFNVSACESGEQDIHRIIQLSVAALAADAAQGDSIAQNVMDFIEGATDAKVLSSTAEYR